MRNIVALSGGESSAAVAVICKDLPNLVLYFNDTHWEDADLYRYIHEVADYVGIPITEDSDGRTPEQLANDQKFLPNNRVPFCSRILKAERLQKWAQPGDVIYFGIGYHEVNRAGRIRLIYGQIGITTRFPLIELQMGSSSARYFMETTGIKRPRMYDLGFEHNNCSGGCVRQGARQWRHLLRVSPGVYAERERMESQFGGGNNGSTFLKDISLKRLREIEECQGEFDYEDDGLYGECVGICSTMA